jgi:hypothetical protein
MTISVSVTFCGGMLDGAVLDYFEGEAPPEEHTLHYMNCLGIDLVHRYALQPKPDRDGMLYYFYIYPVLEPGRA